MLWLAWRAECCSGDGGRASQLHLLGMVSMRRRRVFALGAQVSRICEICGEGQQVSLKKDEGKIKGTERRKDVRRDALLDIDKP